MLPPNGLLENQVSGLKSQWKGDTYKGKNILEEPFAIGRGAYSSQLEGGVLVSGVTKILWKREVLLVCRVIGRFFFWEIFWRG